MIDSLTIQLQNKLLQMLIWFHELCEKENLRYYAVGGTCLGAVRHKGFIPWDDDVDIGMPREDYNQLIEKIGNRKIEHYFLETPDSEFGEYRYPYSKLYDTNTTLIENTWPILKRGIFIDIFPLDGLGNTQEESEKKWKSISKKSNFIWTRVCAVRKQRSLVKNVGIILAHVIPSFLVNDKVILKRINDEASRLGFYNTTYGGNTFGNWGKREIMCNDILGTPSLCEFEGYKIAIPYDYDKYLTRLYGNWRELPPLEKQVTHHDYLELNLNKPYM